MARHANLFWGVMLLLVGLAACGGQATEPAIQPATPTEFAAPTASPSIQRPTIDLCRVPDTTAVVEAASPTEPLAATPAATSEPFTLHSDAFGMDEAIPTRYTCHGEDLSPTLAWTEPPAGTVSFALIMDDPDAVAVAGRVWDHWLLFDLPADLRALPEGVPAGDELENGGRHGANSWNDRAYGGPCPPAGQTHTYVFTLYAADTSLDLPPGATKDEILAALEGHVLETAGVRGTYTSP